MRSEWSAEQIGGYPQALARLVEIVVGPSLPSESTEWGTVISTLTSLCDTDESIDAMYQASIRAADRGRVAEAKTWIAKALAESPGPMWRKRFDALAQGLPVSA
jgi:hypothetical protein